MSQITLLEAKGFLRIDHTAQDGTVQGIIDGIEDWAEEVLGRKFVENTHVEYLTGGGLALRPTNRPILGVSEVHDDDAVYTLVAADYDLVRDGIYRDNMERWEDEPENRWKVTYVAGEDMPSGLKGALLQMIARVYENRTALSRQGAAGYGQDFQSVAGSDIMLQMRPYMRGGCWIG